MPIPPVTEFEGQLPAENDPATFPARAEALFDWLVAQGMPTFNAAVAAINAALNDNGTVLDTAGQAIALTTNANTIVETAGTGNAYTISPAVAVAGYQSGQTFMVRPNRQNSGPVTLRVGALAAVPVRKVAASGSGFVELVAGDWRVGELHIVSYRGSQFELLSVPLNSFVRNDTPQTITAPWTFTDEVGLANFVGGVLAFARNTPPAGWLECNGAAVSRTLYAALFSAIGTRYGAGDGSTTFNLPDLRGEFIRGWDNGRGVDSGRVFGSAQADEFKSHFHQVGGRAVDNSGTGAFDGSSSTDPFTVNTTPVGGAETRPRNVALLYCIKF